MKKVAFLWIIFIVLAISGKAQYSDASLNGAWFIYQEPMTPFGDSLLYLVFDGNGSIIDFSGCGSTNGSNYTVTDNGAISGNLIIVGESTLPFTGQLSSSNLGVLSIDGTDFVLSKISNPGALTDTLTGVLITTGYGQKNIMLKLNILGEIIESSGLTEPVSGRVYTQFGMFLGHIRTGDTLNDEPWHEIGIYGYYANDTLIGEVVVDAPQNYLRVGPAFLIRSGVASTTSINENIKISKEILLYPNPASDLLIINMENYDNEPITLNIYNIFGSLVQSEILHSDHQTISVENLSNGIYIMEMRSKDWIEKQKMIIHKPGH